MITACWAVFYHSLFTDQNPQHHCCPEGAESWWKFQRALALNQDIALHTPTIPLDYADYVKPVFEKLCDQNLLEKCLLGATQNRNKSFNSLIWACAPKTEYTTRSTIEVAVSQAVLVFNSDQQALLPILERLGVAPDPICTEYLAKKDQHRIKMAQFRETTLAKKRRISKRVFDKRAEGAHIEEEGMTYGAGEF